MSEKSCAYCGKPISEEQIEEGCYGELWAEPCASGLPGILGSEGACEHSECCQKILDGIKPHSEDEKHSMNAINIKAEDSASGPNCPKCSSEKVYSRWNCLTGYCPRVCDDCGYEVREKELKYGHEEKVKP